MASALLVSALLASLGFGLLALKAAIDCPDRVGIHSVAKRAIRSCPALQRKSDGATVDNLGDLALVLHSLGQVELRARLRLNKTVGESLRMGREGEGGCSQTGGRRRIVGGLVFFAWG